MLLLILKLTTVISSSVLFWWGGYSFKPARRFIMPFICALVGFLATFCPLAGVGMLLAIFPLCLGYGVDSPLRHCFGNGWGRGVWGALVAICLSLPLFLTHNLGLSLGPLHLDGPIGSLILLFVYVSLNFTLENALKNIPQAIGDPIIGAGFASIVFLIH